MNIAQIPHLPKPPTPTSARQKRHQAAAAAIRLLAEFYPKCFSIYEERRRPLKLNIHLDIQAALDSAITPAELHRALGTYCSNPIYLGHTRTGAWRLDLNGEPAGVVTADEEAHARETLARISTKQKTEPRPRLRPRLKLRPLSGRPSLIRKLLRSRGNTRSIKPMEGIMRESKTQRPAGQGGSKLEKKQSDNRFSSKNLKSEQL